MRALWLVLVAVLAGTVTAQPAAGSASWQPYVLPPPPGGQFSIPAGQPTDLVFTAPNRGLLATAGNSAVKPGLYTYDGASWRQFSTVCGGDLDHGRIIVAGRDDFWTITTPSAPRDVQGPGLALCHYVGGAVVGSYSTDAGVADPYRTILAGACLAPNDCWFGGVGAQDPTGGRVGAFHLHWDGTALTTTYRPSGRAVSDIAAFGGRLFESSYVGAVPRAGDPADLPGPESSPLLLHDIAAGRFVAEDFAIRPAQDVPADGTELLALDAAPGGALLWAVGGQATTGPASAAPQGPPVAALLEGASWTQLPLDASEFAADERFVDVAAVPGSDQAIAAVDASFGYGRTDVRARVARIARDGAVTVESVPASGPPRGAASKVACPATNDCWLATTLGYLFRLTDPADPPRYPQDTDPAFAGTIDFRPNESAEQAVPDLPPVDDSQLFAPPPVEIPPPPPPPAPPVQLPPRRLPALLSKISSRLRAKTLVLEVRFTLARPASVGLVASRKRTVVARVRVRRLKAGRRVLTLKLNRKRYPTKLAFVTNETTTATRPL